MIRKSRVHLYKPIQIAEILYHTRKSPNSYNLLSVEDYRNKSKKWRDDITIVLLGRKCNSSARFQDDLFNKNAIPPSILSILDKENRRTKGAVEAYIYRNFMNKHNQLSEALKYCLDSTVKTFYVKTFIDRFWHEPGLRRSIDKVYEIIVFSLFSTLVSALELKVDISINSEKKDILLEFSDFAKMVMCIDTENPISSQNARIFRVGVTNAADRGLDMYSNWGPAIQIKHLSLNEELAENIVDHVSSDRIIIVCKDAEQRLIYSILNQIGWKSKIQSVITEQNLITWYEKALRGKHSTITGKYLLQCLSNEIISEFPSVGNFPKILRSRGYEKINNNFWS
ncbi:MAG: HaeII family restriction endonuclease [Treponema sp.]|nr:HaeII family restriction endonuclease [Treponema sp.]